MHKTIAIAILCAIGLGGALVGMYNFGTMVGCKKTVMAIYPELSNADAKLLNNALNNSCKVVLE